MWSYEVNDQAHRTDDRAEAPPALGYVLSLPTWRFGDISPGPRASPTWLLASRVTQGERRSRAAKEPEDPTATNGKATWRALGAGTGQQCPSKSLA